MARIIPGSDQIILKRMEQLERPKSDFERISLTSSLLAHLRIKYKPTTPEAGTLKGDQK